MGGGCTSIVAVEDLIVEVPAARPALDLWRSARHVPQARAHIRPTPRARARLIYHPLDHSIIDFLSFRESDPFTASARPISVRVASRPLLHH
ncbi:hypothetical protein J6590_047131 [Homalodisca vitripennis]|nr:hypothetical protein J6590_047130 [Homalodisca vitripennis]KAG8277257.1 hypothetical protein J6590_047131 [Homalodisca vitripennis]